VPDWEETAAFAAHGRARGVTVERTALLRQGDGRSAAPRAGRGDRRPRLAALRRAGWRAYVDAVAAVVGIVGPILP
jgi:hypothetical protein